MKFLALAFAFTLLIVAHAEETNKLGSSAVCVPGKYVFVDGIHCVCLDDGISLKCFPREEKTLDVSAKTNRGSAP